MDGVRGLLFDVLLRRRVGRESFGAWFAGTEVYEASDRLVLVMTTRFQINWVDEYYRDDILAAAREAWPDVRRIVYIRRTMVQDERGMWVYQPDLKTEYPSKAPGTAGS